MAENIAACETCMQTYFRRLMQEPTLFSGIR